MLLNNFIDALHFFFILIPVIIYIFPVSNVKIFFKFILLVFILNPLSWQLSNNECIMTKMTKAKDDKSLSTSPFSEKYFAWIYKPILQIFKKEWNATNINLAVITHYCVNLLLLWIYLFFVAKKNIF